MYVYFYPIRSLTMGSGSSKPLVLGDHQLVTSWFDMNSFVEVTIPLNSV